MPEFSQKWCLVGFTDPVSDNKQFFWKNWLPHITIVGVFAIDTQPDELREKLASILTGTRSLELTQDEEAFWGEKGDIHVMKLQKTNEVISLHKKVYKTVLNLGAKLHDEQFCGDGYIPHFTLDAARQPLPVYRINSISLVDMFPNGDGYERRVVWTIPLKP